MGGRGGYSGKYRHLDLGGLERQRAYNAAETEVAEIDKAIAQAKKRKRNNTPF